MINIHEFFTSIPALAHAFGETVGFCLGLMGTYLIAAGSIFLGGMIALVGFCIFGLFFVVITWWYPVANPIQVGLYAVYLGSVIVIVSILVNMVFRKIYLRINLEDTVAILVPSIGVMLILGGIGTMANIFILG